MLVAGTAPRFPRPLLSACILTFSGLLENAGWCLPTWSQLHHDRTTIGGACYTNLISRIDVLFCESPSRNPSQSIRARSYGTCHDYRRLNCQYNNLRGKPAQYAPAQAYKLTISSYLFARWYLFDLSTLKVVSDSRVTWATSVLILVFLGLSVLDRRQTAS